MSEPAAWLQAMGVTRRFGDGAAVNAVSLELHVGELHALVGAVGAGKSTLVDLLSGDVRPSAGRVTFVGRDITHWPQSRRARRGIARIYQHGMLFGEFSVLENCRLAAQAARPRPWAVWEAASRCGASLRAAHEALEWVGLHEDIDAPADNLSLGGKRRLELAMCLSMRPSVLLLDEPLAGMNAQETQRMLALLMRLKANHAVLLVEQSMEAVKWVADTISVMAHGILAENAEPERASHAPAVRLFGAGDTIPEPR